MGSAPLAQKVKLHSVLLRPGVDVDLLARFLPNVENKISLYDSNTVKSAEIAMKYEGYIRKEKEMVDKMNRLEDLILKEDFPYDSMTSLSAEGKEKLRKIRPHTLGQASRISGVSPSDISVLLVHMGR